MARLGQLAAAGWRVPDGYAVTAGALDGLAAGRGAGRARTGCSPRARRRRRAPGALAGLSERARAARRGAAAACRGSRTRSPPRTRGSRQRTGRGRRAAGRGPVVGGERGRARGQLRRASTRPTSACPGSTTCCGTSRSAGRAGTRRTRWSTGGGSAAAGARCTPTTSRSACSSWWTRGRRAWRSPSTRSPATGTRWSWRPTGGSASRSCPGRSRPTTGPSTGPPAGSLTRRTGEKRVWSVFEPRRPAGWCSTPLPPPTAPAQACLTDDEVRYICEQAAAIEAADGGAPQDVEWAIARELPFPDSVFFLQHRPETTWTAGPRRRGPPPAPRGRVRSRAVRAAQRVPGARRVSPRAATDFEAPPAHGLPATPSGGRRGRGGPGGRRGADAPGWHERRPGGRLQGRAGEPGDGRGPGIAAGGHRRRSSPPSPTHAIDGEEGTAGNPDASHVWYVDPLDGTTNYAHGLPFFCVSVALRVHGRTVAGAVYDPLHDEMFAAALGGGATLNGAAAARLRRRPGWTGRSSSRRRRRSTRTRSARTRRWSSG